MGDQPTETETTGPAPSPETELPPRPRRRMGRPPSQGSREAAWRGKGILQVRLPLPLLERVRAVRLAQRRTLIAFVEMALEERVEMAERFGAASAVGVRLPRARRKRVG